MSLKKARQFLKTFADDTRLRIINLLNTKELTVTEICEILEKNQPNISKHLAKLRLTNIVGDRREGMNVYYYLKLPKEESYQNLTNAILNLSDLEIFKDDLAKTKKYFETKSFSAI